MKKSHDKWTWQSAAMNMCSMSIHMEMRWVSRDIMVRTVSVGGQQSWALENRRSIASSTAWSGSCLLYYTWSPHSVSPIGAQLKAFVVPSRCPPQISGTQKEAKKGGDSTRQLHSLMLVNWNPNIDYTVFAPPQNSCLCSWVPLCHPINHEFNHIFKFLSVGGYNGQVSGAGISLYVEI